MVSVFGATCAVGLHIPCRNTCSALDKLLETKLFSHSYIYQHFTGLHSTRKRNKVGGGGRGVFIAEYLPPLVPKLIIATNVYQAQEQKCEVHQFT